MRAIKRFIAVICAFLMLPALSFKADAIDYAPLAEDPTESVIEIEAESFTPGSFKTVENASASGGKCIVSAAGERASYKINLEYTVDNFVLYAVHQADSRSNALTYIAVDHMENYSLYDYKYGQWNETRIYYGSVPKGEHTIYLQCVREGQKIDKFIIKYQKSASAEILPATDTKNNYQKGTAENAALNIAEATKETPGSFFFEIEEATSSNKMRIGYDEDASGGAYWYAPPDEGLAHITDVNMTDEIFARFKFDVKIRGKYRMWVRYYTPQAMQKTTWFAIDNKNYYRLEDNFSDAWEWKQTSNAYYLDEGTHTLDIKYRQPGQQIDCVILTMVEGFTAAGVGSLPGEPLILGEGEYKTIANVAKLSKLKVNNYRAKPDEEFVVEKNDILVPATSVTELLGQRIEEHGDNFVVYTEGRGYLKFYTDSTRAIVNGKVKNTQYKAYKHNGVIPMVSLSLLQEAFGFDYEYDAAQTTLHIFYNPEENYREASEEELILEGGERTVRYTIPHDNPEAKVEVWIKYNLADAGLFRRQNYDNMNSLATGGCIYKYVTMSEWSYWKKAPTPLYRDGAFHGSEYVSTIAPYDVKVRIVENGKENIFVKRNCVKPRNVTYTSKISAKEYAYKTNGELLLVPTFENIGYYIDYSGEDASCEVIYREKDTEEWKKALAPVYDKTVGQFRGSIVYLKEGTYYEVKAQIKSVGGSVISEKSAQAQTKNLDVKIAETINLSDIYSGEGTLLLRDMHGSEDGWIKIVGDGTMINALTDTTTEAVLFDRCSYIIFEDVKVRGGGLHGVLIGDECSDIRIINCDIAQWGHETAYDEQYGRHQRFGGLYNNSGGVYLMNAKNVLIERCYIHDSKITTNEWNNDDYKNIHPAGSTGIQMMGLSGVVIRYNDVVGSDKHRYNDVMEGTSNGSRNNSSTGSDADIYGNMMIYGEDDCIELDGGQMNVRVYKNRMEQTRCGISTAPNMMGPSYLFNNLIVNLGGSWKNESGSAVKAGGAPDGVMGLQYFINNTMDSEASGPTNINYSGSSNYHAFSRNNIFVTHKSARNALANKAADERDDFDYDLIYGGIFNVPGENREMHGVFAEPQYVDASKGIYHLTESSPGTNGGTYIDNFNEDTAPNMGVYEKDDTNAFMPYRPVDMYADKYRVELRDGEVGEITVNLGKIGENRNYSILKSLDDDWLEILQNETEDIPAAENSTVTFKIKGDMTRCERAEGKSMVIFRLDNGYSIPVTVYVTK